MMNQEKPETESLYVETPLADAERTNQYLEEMGLTEIGYKEWDNIMPHSRAALDVLNCSNTTNTEITLSLLKSENPKNKYLISYLRFTTLMDHIIYLPENYKSRITDRSRKIFTYSESELSNDPAMCEAKAYLMHFMSSLALVNYDKYDSRTQETFVSVYEHYFKNLTSQSILPFAQGIKLMYEEYLAENRDYDIETFLEHLKSRQAGNSLSTTDLIRAGLAFQPEIGQQGLIGLHDMEYDDRITQFLRQ